MAKRFEIRNSTAEFLIFVLEGKEDGIQVMYKDETIWATQKAMAQLFDCSSDNIGLHLKNIFASRQGFSYREKLGNCFRRKKLSDYVL